MTFCCCSRCCFLRKSTRPHADVTAAPFLRSPCGEQRVNSRRGTARSPLAPGRWRRERTAAGSISRSPTRKRRLGPLRSRVSCFLPVLVCRSLRSVAPSQHPAPLRTRDFFSFPFFFILFSVFFFFFLFFFSAGGRAGSMSSTHVDPVSALHFMSTSKSNTSSLVSSVPFRLPTAHTSFVLEALIRHTTPPLPPLSSVTRLRINSPVFKSHSFTVPSSELVMTKFLLNCKQVTAL